MIMDELHRYIPESKHDTELIEELSKHPYPYYRPVLRELFEWIQDMNWPVARLIAPLLAKAGTDVIPAVREILKTEDTVWIYWTLTVISDRFNYNDGRVIVSELKNELIEKMKTPTEAEKAEGIDEVIKELFEKYKIRYWVE